MTKWIISTFFPPHFSLSCSHTTPPIALCTFVGPCPVTMALQITFSICNIFPFYHLFLCFLSLKFNSLFLILFYSQLLHLSKLLAVY